MKDFIANKHGQSLASHSVLVGRLAAAIIDEMYGRSAFGQADGLAKVQQMLRVAKLSGLLHDIGKIDVEFQSYIASVQKVKPPAVDGLEDGAHIDEGFDKKRFSFEAYPRHEEVSWLLLRRLLVKARVQREVLTGDNIGGPAHTSQFGMLEHAVYWHHAKPLRERDAQQTRSGDAEQLASRMHDQAKWLQDDSFEDLRRLLTQIDAIESTNLVGLMCAGVDDVATDSIKTPAFKAIYQDDLLLLGGPLKLEQGISVEMTRTAIRSAVVSADRIVSRLTAVELEEYIALGKLPHFRTSSPGMGVLYRQLDSMAEHYATTYPGNRTETQTTAAFALASVAAKTGIACL